MSADLRTRYLGLELRNPVVASASPFTGRLDMLRRLEDAGAAAVVLPSLFEEQVEHEEMAVHDLLETAAHSHQEATGYFPELDDYNTGPGSYLRHLEAARRALSIPVIGSLNGTTRGGWVGYARLMEDAGASAVEVNVYRVATDPTATSAQVEDEVVDLVAAVRAAVTIPLAVKIGPHYTALAALARRLVQAGADGLVLFNRFMQPDIDLDTLTVVDTVELSTAAELRLPLRWVAILRGCLRTSLAATTGVHGAEDVLKLLLAGADVTMMTSALLQQGPEHVRRVLEGVQAWLDEREYESVRQMRGSMSQASCPDPAAFERAHYMRAVTTYAPAAV